MQASSRLMIVVVILASMGVASHGRALDLDAKNWAAWINRQAPGPTSLHVVGNFMLANPGQVATLRPVTAEGSSPRVLVLELEVEQKPGNWPMPMVPGQARYEVKSYHANPVHSQVMIRFGGSEITIDVHEVH